MTDSVALIHDALSAGWRAVAGGSDGAIAVKRTLPPPAALSQTAELLAFYAEMVAADNERFGLIGREDAIDTERLVRRHIVDSLSVLPHVADMLWRYHCTTLYDLGSGAGFPGVPLAVALATPAVLVERRAKRVAFLSGAVARLRARANAAGAVMPTITPHETETRRLRGVERALVVFRAYQQTTPELIRELAAVFPHGTPVCALKGRHGQSAEERDVVAAEGERSGTAHHAAVVTLPAIDGAERSALLWKTGSVVSEGPV